MRPYFELLDVRGKLALEKNETVVLPNAKSTGNGCHEADPAVVLFGAVPGEEGLDRILASTTLPKRSG